MKLCLIGLSSLVLVTSFQTMADRVGSNKEQRRGPPKFSQLDLNNDGEITLGEFSEHTPPHKTSEEIFKSIDINGDDIITEKELTSHTPPKGKCCKDK